MLFLPVNRILKRNIEIYELKLFSDRVVTH